METPLLRKFAKDNFVVEYLLSWYNFVAYFTLFQPVMVLKDGMSKYTMYSVVLEVCWW